jgi:predicted acetyltransferase
MHHGERIVPVGGVSAVATALADRGKGVANELMRHCVTRSREIGRPTSMLYAFSLRFYRDLGYEVAGHICRYSLRIRDIPPSREPGQVREVDAKPGPLFEDVYKKWAQRYRGPFERRQGMWDRIFRIPEKHARYAFVYEDEEGPQGYVQFRFNERAWENGPPAPPKTLALREFVALKPEAHRALLGTLSRFDMQEKRVGWSGAADDYVLCEPYEDLEVKLDDQPMMRATDVAALLAVPAPPEVSAAYSVTVADYDWAGGNQTFTVSLDAGKPSVRPGGDAGVAMSQRAFIRCWVGDPDARALRRAGQVEVTDERQFDAFCAHFPRAVFYCADGF